VKSKRYGVKPCLGVEEMASEQIYFDRWEVRPESILWFTRREVADAGSATRIRTLLLAPQTFPSVRHSIRKLKVRLQPAIAPSLQ
jgi:hypothetical protein